MDRTAVYIHLPVGVHVAHVGLELGSLLQCTKGVVGTMQTSKRALIAPRSTNGALVASGCEKPIATEGSTFDELLENIRDAVATYFEGDDPTALGFESRLSRQAPDQDRRRRGEGLDRAHFGQ